MNIGKWKAVFFIIVFLLLLALVVHWALGLDAKKHPADVPPEETQQAEPTPPLVHETPSPTPAPQQPTAPTPPPANQPAQPSAPTPAPQQPTAPTPVPTPTPKPAGQELGSGSFRSETGTGLELICDWRAVTVEGNKAEVTLTIGIESATIQLNEWTDCIGLRVGDQTGTMTQPKLDYEGGYTTHSFGSRTFTVDLSKASSFSVAVEWHYNGRYGGTPLDVLVCGGTISF